LEVSPVSSTDQDETFLVADELITHILKRGF